MMQQHIREQQKKVAKMMKDKGIILTVQEQENIEITDIGLGDFYKEGMGVVTYVNNENYCAKELVLFPNQTFPEHNHPPVEGFMGKRETFRCRFGKVYLYVEGESTQVIQAMIPAPSKDYYRVMHEVVLLPGQQYTIEPNTWHWFQAGSEGAIVSEFSTSSRDELDIFRNPRVVRV